MSDNQGTKRVLQWLVRVDDSFDLSADADREFFLDDVRSVVEDTERAGAMVEVLGLREVSTHYPEMVSEWVGEHDRARTSHDDTHQQKSARTSLYRMISRLSSAHVEELNERIGDIIKSEYRDG